MRYLLIFILIGFSTAACDDKSHNQGSSDQIVRIETPLYSIEGIHIDGVELSSPSEFIVIEEDKEDDFYYGKALKNYYSILIDFKKFFSEEDE